MGSCNSTQRPAWHAATPPLGAWHGEQFGMGAGGAPPVDSPKFGFSPGFPGAVFVFGSGGRVCNGTTASMGSACDTGQQPQGLR